MSGVYSGAVGYRGIGRIFHIDSYVLGVGVESLA